MRKQSRLDRLKRLEEGRCPIHGTGMSQIDLEYVLQPCGHYEQGRVIVECPRRDCPIKAFWSEPFIGANLLPEFKNLIS